jgi:electron transport complex protein RnfB
MVDACRCVGCGLCTTACPTEALHLERRPKGQVPPPPADFKDWMDRRARERGLKEMP